MNGVSNVTFKNSNIGPCAGHAIKISGGSGNNIFDSYLHSEGPSNGCCDNHEGVFITGGSTHDLIQGNVIAFNESNVEVIGADSISVIGNYLANPLGPFPRGQNFQSGSGTTNLTINNNYAYSCTFTSGVGVLCPTSPRYLLPENQEDSINFYQSTTFTAQSNYVVGGHSGSGCGMIFDNQANNGQMLNNILSNTGQCGIGVGDGTNPVVTGNKILNLTPVSGGGNTALYVWKQYTSACGSTTVTNNIADELKTDGVTHSGYWNGGGCDPTTLTGNTFNAAAYSLLFPMATTNPPPLIPPQPKNCVANSPFSTQTSLPPCS
jgi:hypothetical protein